MYIITYVFFFRGLTQFVKHGLQREGNGTKVDFA